MADVEGRCDWAAVRILATWVEDLLVWTKDHQMAKSEVIGNFHKYSKGDGRYWAGKFELKLFYMERGNMPDSFASINKKT